MGDYPPTLALLARRLPTPFQDHQAYKNEVNDTQNGTFFPIYPGPSGANVQELEEEDALLVDDMLSPANDDDMAYHERMGPMLTREVWNLNEEDIDADFPAIPGQFPSINVNPPQVLCESV